MKKFKSALILLLTGLICTTSACMGQSTVSYNMFEGSHWLTSPEANIGSIDETCVYSVVFEANVPEDENENFLTAENFVGSLTTRLAKSEYNGKECYKFETDFSLSGTCYYDDKEHSFTDKASSEVYLLGLNDKFSPLYSKKYNLSTAPIVSSNLTEAKFAVMEYQTETVYDLENKKATVKFEGLDKSSEGYKLPNSEREYENYAGSNFFDNESLLFVPRAAGFSDQGFSGSFTTIDAMSEKILKMYLSVSSTNPTSDVVLTGANLNGIVGDYTLPTYNAQISINDTFSGSAIQLFYAVDTTTHHRRLLQYKKELAYSAGYLVYTLTSVTVK